MSEAAGEYGPANTESRQDEFCAQDAGNQIREAAWLFAVTGGFAGGGNVKSVLHEDSNDRPDGLSEHDTAPTGRPEHTGEVRKSHQGQRVRAYLHTIQSEYVLYETAAEEFFGIPDHV